MTLFPVKIGLRHFDKLKGSIRKNKKGREETPGRQIFSW